MPVLDRTKNPNTVIPAQAGIHVTIPLFWSTMSSILAQQPAQKEAFSMPKHTWILACAGMTAHGVRFWEIKILRTLETFGNKRTVFIRTKAAALST